LVSLQLRRARDFEERFSSPLDFFSCSSVKSRRQEFPHAILQGENAADSGFQGLADFVEEVCESVVVRGFINGFAAGTYLGGGT